MNKVNLKYQFTEEENWLINILIGTIEPYKSNFQLINLHNFAKKNGFAPYLFYLASNKKIELPQELYQLLKQDYYSSFIRNTQILNTKKELDSFFINNNLKPIPLKGIVLSTSIYPDPAIRPMSDMDILFLNHEAEKAFQLLLSKGGICKNKEKEHDKLTGHQFPGIIYNGILIEIHRSLFDTDLNFTIPNNYLSKELKNNTFSAEINFVYLALHAYHTMRRGGIRLSWFFDLILLSQEHVINRSIFLKIIKDLNIDKPIKEVIAQIEFIFNIQFDFIPNKFRLELTTKEKQNLIKLIHHSHQQDNKYSYELALERLKNTKGISNKLKFIKSVISDNTENSPGTIQRSFILISRLFRYIIYKIRNR